MPPRAAIGAVMTCVLTGSACLAQTPAPPAPALSAEQPVRGGRIVRGVIADIRTMNPILAADAHSASIAGLLYDDFIRADKDTGEPKARMAKFEQSKDGLTYTFTIDPRAIWSDGWPVVAEDWYVAKKLVAMSKISVRKSLFQDIQGWQDFVDGAASEISGVTIDPADPKRFTVRLSRVFCPALANIGAYTLPTHVFGKYARPGQADAIDRAPENIAPTVFSGPFKFKEWRQGDQVTLVRNDAYWKGAPNVDELVSKILSDSNIVAAQLKTGEVNFAQIDPKDAAEMGQQPHLRVTRVREPFYRYIAWRIDSPTVPAFADKRVRQALAYGLDMDAVIKAVLFGEGTKQVAHHAPVQWAYPDPATLEQYRYDGGKAEDLLRQAGYSKGADGVYARDGKRLAFTIRAAAGFKIPETFAQIAAEQYRGIGVEAKTSFEAQASLISRLGSRNFEALINAWQLGAEPDPYTIWHSSQIPDPAAKRAGFGFTGFRDPALDRAIEEARNPSTGDCSHAARKQQYATFNRILNEEQPYNFGHAQNTLYVTSAGLQGFRPGSFGLGEVTEWWLRPGN